MIHYKHSNMFKRFWFYNYLFILEPFTPSDCFSHFSIIAPIAFLPPDVNSLSNLQKVIIKNCNDFFWVVWTLPSSKLTEIMVKKIQNQNPHYINPFFSFSGTGYERMQPRIQVDVVKSKMVDGEFFLSWGRKALGFWAAAHTMPERKKQCWMKLT